MSHGILVNACVARMATICKSCTVGNCEQSTIFTATLLGTFLHIDFDVNSEEMFKQVVLLRPQRCTGSQRRSHHQQSILL